MKSPKIRFKGFDGDWEQRKLGWLVDNDVIEAPKDGNHGEKHPTSDEYVEEGIPFLMASDIRNGRVDLENCKYITKERAEQLDKGFAQEGDVLLTHKATIGEVAILEGLQEEYAMLTPQVTYYRILDNKRLSQKYLYAVFHSESFQNEMQTKAAQSTRPYIGISAQQNLTISLPCSTEEQQRIGEYFASLDTLITLHQKKCEQLTILKKYMLQKMFPQNGSDKPEIRFDGFTDDWEQRKLSELATMHARIGWQNLRTSEFLDAGDYMLITGTDFEDGKVNYSTCHYVEKERYDQDKNIQIKNGNILITKDGTLGKVAYVEGLSLPATLNAGVFNVEVKDENETDSKYLFQFLKAPFLMDYVSKKATGGTIKHLNQNILVDFPIAMPNKAEQVRIGEYFSNLDNLITLHQNKCNELKELKKFMLQNMFV